MLAASREWHIGKLRRDAEHARAIRESNHGRYVEMDDKKKALRVTTDGKAKLVLVHFCARALFPPRLSPLRHPAPPLGCSRQLAPSLSQR